MRYDSLRSLEKHLEESSPLFSPLYFIVGKDAFECEEAIELLLKFLLPAQEPKELALTVFDGHQLEEGTLGNALYSGSFFAKKSIIWIQKAEKLKSSLQENLEMYLKHPSPSQFLILSATSWNKSTSFYKTADKAGVILDFAELKPWEKEKRLIEWVSKQTTAARKLISYPVCQYLVKRIGNDQALLSQELDKLICYCSEKQEITRRDVEAICPHLQVDSIWQLGEAIFQRDSSTALQVGHSILMDGQPLLPLLRQIRSQFQNGFQISLLLSQGKQAQDIAQEFPQLKGQILEKNLQQARNYGIKAFKEGFLALEAAEMRAKNSSIDEKIILELLLMQLVSNPSFHSK